MEQAIITIIGTKGVKQDDSPYMVYTKQEVVERIEELLDEGYGFSVIQARK